MRLKMPHRYANTYRAKHSRYCYQQKDKYIVAHFPAERKEENERNYRNASDIA